MNFIGTFFFGVLASALAGIAADNIVVAGAVASGLAAIEMMVKHQLRRHGLVSLDDSAQSKT